MLFRSVHPCKCRSRVYLTRRRLLSRYRTDTDRADGNGTAKRNDRKELADQEVIFNIDSVMTLFVTKPLGVMVSSTDQTPQVPFTYLFIIHYIERPAPSVRLVKSIHLRAFIKLFHNIKKTSLGRSFFNIHEAITPSS